jgi:cation:H+ antiporter
MALDGRIVFYEGIVLIFGLLSFIGFCSYSAFKRPLANGGVTTDFKESQKSGELLRRSIGFSLLGLFSLIGGAHFIVTSAVYIAKSFGISELVIGLSMVAIGTSLPELATSMVASYRKEPEICIGNVVGSNIFNILFVVGTIAIITTLRIDGWVLKFHFPCMLLFTIAIFPLMKTGFIISRKEGMILLLGYLIFVALLF